MKWVSLRPDIDALTGAVHIDDRWSGPSLADQAALEIALRMGEARNTSVHVVTVGPPSADTMLRDALAVGATSATRIECATSGQPTSASVAAALANEIGRLNPSMVLCGDWSLDRGSGSVPPFLAAELDIGQACGLIAILDEPNQPLRAQRRLDGGRREHLQINGPAVLSVEGAVATLRRASLAATLAAQRTVITVTNPNQPLATEATPQRSGPFRPRARVLDGPSTSETPRARIETLTGALANRNPPRKLVVDPETAATAILTQLHAWGYTSVDVSGSSSNPDR